MLPPRRPDQNAGTQPTGGPRGAGFPSSGTVRARQVIIIGTGGLLLVYSPSAAAGNLIESIAAAAGTDQFGNAYMQGHTNYGGLGGGALGAMAALNLNSSSLQWNTAPSFAGPWTAQNVFGFTQVGSVFRTTLTAGSFRVLGLMTLQPQSGGLIGNVPSVQLPDHTSITVTAVAATAITKAWSIPAGDAQADTTYRLTAYGFGTNGSTVQNMTWAVGLNGTAIASSNTQQVGAGSNPLRWEFDVILHVLTTGAGGTADASLRGSVSTFGGTTLGLAFNAGIGSAGGQAFNTTVSNTLELMMNWASTTGAPTATGIFSMLERMGP